MYGLPGVDAKIRARPLRERHIHAEKKYVRASSEKKGPHGYFFQWSIEYLENSGFSSRRSHIHRVFLYRVPSMTIATGTFF